MTNVYVYFILSEKKNKQLLILNDFKFFKHLDKKKMSIHGGVLKTSVVLKCTQRDTSELFKKDSRKIIVMENM